MAKGIISRIINKIRHRKEEGTHSEAAVEVARYDLDVVEVQNSIISDLAEVNRLLLEELANYRAIEDEDRHLLMMIEDVEEGKEDLKRLLEP